MSIGIVTDNDFDKELDNLKGEPIVGEVVEKSHPGRSNGDVNVPESLRKIIGDSDTRQEALALAEMFGVSESSASAYTRGATSTSSYNTPNRELLLHIRARKDRASQKAHKTLDQALDNITEDKLKDIPARHLAGIAKDMSAVIRNLEPEIKESDSELKPQFIVYAPQFRKEENFEVIVVGE